MDIEQLSGAIEAIVFVSGDPVPIKRMEEVLEIPEEQIREAIEALSKRYVELGAGIQVMEVAGGYQLRTRPIYSIQVNKFLERKRKTTLSGPALETLAIIAYKQPITRAEIEAIRGVVVDCVLKSLLDKRLIKVAGVKEVPGRPNLYRTTRRFLEYFGIVSLNDLPPIENIEQTFAGSSGTSGEEPVGDADSDSESEKRIEELPSRENQSSAQSNIDFALRDRSESSNEGSHTPE